jgi:hypothetical protein
MPVCGDACVETWSAWIVTGKMNRRPVSRSTGVRTSHHGPVVTEEMFGGRHRHCCGERFFERYGVDIENANRPSHGRLRRLLAIESRLRQPDRRSCLLTLPTSLEMSPNVAVG